MSSESESKTADQSPEAEPTSASTAGPPSPKPPVSEATYRARRRWLAGAIVLVAMAAVAGLYFFLPGREEEPPEAKRPLINVKVMAVVAEDFHDTFHLPGVVEPNRTVTVSARVGGQVTDVGRVDGRAEGRHCEAGETIVTLDAEQLAARVAQADAQVKQYAAQIAQAQAQRDLARFELDSIAELLKKNASTEFAHNQAKASLAAAAAGIEQARAGLAGAEAARNAANLDLGYATITAPCAGVLDEVMVEVGETVDSGAPVARIVDTAAVRVVVDVPQSDIRYLKVGQLAVAQGDRDVHGQRAEVSGTIDYISELADVNAKTTRVEVLVVNGSRVLRSGQIVRVRLTRRTIPRAVMVPLEAVIPLEGKKRAVYVVDKDDTARRRLVTLGAWQGRHVQILPDDREVNDAGEAVGLRPGDVLIIQGHRRVAEDQRVRIDEDTPDSQPASAPSSQPARSVVSSGRSQAAPS